MKFTNWNLPPCRTMPIRFGIPSSLQGEQHVTIIRNTLFAADSEEELQQWIQFLNRIEGRDMVESF